MTMMMMLAAHNKAETGGPVQRESSGAMLQHPIMLHCVVVDVLTVTTLPSAPGHPIVQLSTPIFSIAPVTAQIIGKACCYGATGRLYCIAFFACLANQHCDEMQLREPAVFRRTVECPMRSGFSKRVSRSQPGFESLYYVHQPGRNETPPSTAVRLISLPMCTRSPRTR